MALPRNAGDSLLPNMRLKLAGALVLEEASFKRMLGSNESPAFLPNMRLKLAGALVLEEAVGSCPGGHGTSSTTLAPAGGSPAA